MAITKTYFNETTGRLYKLDATGGAFNTPYDYKVQLWNDKAKEWTGEYDCKAMSAIKAIACFERHQAILDSEKETSQEQEQAQPEAHNV